MKGDKKTNSHLIVHIIPMLIANFTCNNDLLNNAVDLNVTTKVCDGMLCESACTKWDYNIEKAKL